jgi:hypothetical protein
MGRGAPYRPRAPNMMELELELVGEVLGAGAASKERQNARSRRGALLLDLIESGLGLDCVPRIPLWSDCSCGLLAEFLGNKGESLRLKPSATDDDEALGAGPLRCCSSALSNDS